MSLTERRVAPSPDPGLSARLLCPQLFAVDVRAIPGETVLTLHGELDISTQQQFAAALAGVDENVSRIVLDLSDLEFIDCANIGLIQQTRIMAGLRGAHVELRNPNPQLDRIFELTGLSASNGNGARPIVLPLPARAYERPRAAAVGHSEPLTSGVAHGISDTRADAGPRGGDGIAFLTREMGG